jgi:RNA-directed DNA polymerase
MKTYANLYKKLHSAASLKKAFENAKKGKSKKSSVIKFEKNLENELNDLQKELQDQTYYPKKQKKFIIRDPKTRKIHASDFRDRVVHHALMLSIQDIFQKTFIHDSFANQKNKGTHKAIVRFDQFKKIISKNGRSIKNPYNNNSIHGYVLKADIKHYFDTVDHEILIKIIKKKVKDEKIIWLIRQILENFETPQKGKGMPLGNYTSQFFANLYLNELDYFVKHHLKARFYIRYVDDFVILHKRKKILELYKTKITKFLAMLKLELQPEKSKIAPLKDGITFLGYKIFYHHKRLRKRNLKSFQRKFNKKLDLYKQDQLSKEKIEKSLQGWFGYACWANTYKLRQSILKKLKDAEESKKNNKRC